MFEEKQILLTGASGQLGKTFRSEMLDKGDYDLVPTGREELDITNADHLESYIEKHEFAAVINCAAYTQVDRAESDFDNAMKVNARAVASLARMCAERKIPLIHFSTDYVYDNGLNRPIREEDATAPKGKYGISKLEGERAIREAKGPHYILRTSWVYSEYGSNFLKTMLGLAASKHRLQVVYDQIGAPTYTRDIVNAVRYLLGRALNPDQPGLYGTYNFSNEGVCSWYDFALAIFEQAGKPIVVDPVLSVSFPRPAPRPAFSVLDKAKIKTAFDLEIRHWRVALRACLERIKDLDKA